jgi:hypothetical protein
VLDQGRVEVADEIYGSCRPRLTISRVGAFTPEP